MKDILISYFSISLIIFVTALSSSAQKDPNEYGSKINSAANFTENKGQIHDQAQKPRRDILFSGADGILSFHLRKTGISYQISRVDTWKDSFTGAKSLYKGENRKIPDQSTIYRVDINWLGANKTARIIKGRALGGYSNFYSGSCPNGALFVKSFDEVTYKDIYPGIDLKWYQKNGHLKYDYIVSPGADYKLIKLDYEGAEKISLNSKGDLIITTPLGEITEEAPVVWQNGKLLKSKWLIRNNIVSFIIEKADNKQSLVIDPIVAVRSWGTYYGYTGTIGYTCATDSSKNVYIGGMSSTTLGIATSGAHQSTFSGLVEDAFLAKFNSNGVRLWGTYYGGAGEDCGYSCACDLAGNVFLAGITNSASVSGIATIGAHQSSYGGGAEDVFLVKFSGNGVRQWGTFYGDSGGENGASCAIDLAGNVFLAGVSMHSSGTVIATSGSHQPSVTISGAFLAKFNSAGQRLWGTYYGNGSSGNSCTTDIFGNVYLAGFASANTGTIISTAGSHQSTNGGGFDAFLAKFDAFGVRQWGTFYGGAVDEIGISCNTDAMGNVYLAGQTNGNSGTVLSSVGCHQSSFAGSYDAFLAKFNSSGVRQWSTYYGTSGIENVGSCVTDLVGNVFLCGYTGCGCGTSTVMATPGSHQPYSSGTTDAYLVKFNGSGQRVWGTYYGGDNVEIGGACATDVIGDVYMAGVSTSSDGISTPGSHLSTHSLGPNAAFLVKFFDCTQPSSPMNITPPANLTYCDNSTTTLSAATNSGVINWFASSSSTLVLGTGTNFAVPLLAAGTYTFFSESHTCASSATRTALTLTVNPSPTISISDGTICSGQSFTLLPSGANTYTIQGGVSVVSPTVNVSYTVIGSSIEGCISQTQATSNVFVIANPTIIVNSGTICSGSSLTILPTGAINYSIQGNNSIVSPTSNTNYTVVGTSYEGCLSQNQATCIVLVNPNPTVSVNSGTICSGNTFTIVPNGAMTYSIQGGNSIVNPTANASYTVGGTSIDGCISKTQAVCNVSVVALPIITVNNGTICIGSTFTIVPAGGISYTFSAGSSVVNPTATSTYSVFGTNNQGCTSINPATSNVFVNPLPIIYISQSDSTICVGESVTLTATGGLGFSWSFGGVGATMVVTPLTSSIYTATGTDVNGCLNSATVSLYVEPCTDISIHQIDVTGTYVFPNPFTNRITIISKRKEQLIQIFSAQGSIICQRTMEAEVTEIDLTSVAAGIYTVKIGSFVKKVVKE